jgi:putative membrane protein
LKDQKTKDWILRFVKGMFIGSGFILPGVSGGALAAVFGIYERIISFLAHLTKNFKENVLFFIPVGLGGVTGVFLLSFVVSFLLGTYETPILWFFVGCIIGTVPSLWKEAGKKGRNNADVIVMIITFIVGLIFLAFGEKLFHGAVDQNFFTWMIAGFLIGLGMIVPGLSPSNFLVYMGMYKAMADGFKDGNLGVIVPLAIGGLVCVLGLSKVMDFIFQKSYAKLFHFILGIVFASTIMIVPKGYSGFGIGGYLACVLLTIGGALLGWWMSNLEEKYLPDEEKEEEVY